MSWLSGLIQKIPGIGPIINDVAKPVDALANGVLKSNPVTGAALGAAQAIGNYIPNPLGGAQGTTTGGTNPLGALGSFLTGNSGANALGLAQGINAAQLQQKANQYATNALGDTQAAYNAKAPLRAQALSQLPGAINANPFSRGTVPASGGLAAQPITRTGG